jgi:hypothetical protein
MNQNQNQRREQSSSQPTISSEFRAVLTILNADEELRLKALPHVSVERREINWERIFRNDFASGHRAALLWAKSLFRDEAPVLSELVRHKGQDNLSQKSVRISA